MVIRGRNPLCDHLVAGRGHFCSECGSKVACRPTVVIARIDIWRQDRRLLSRAFR
jgi:hypothetical protein